VWWVCLDSPGGRVQRLTGVLSTDERARAERFHFRRDRDRFITRRGLLRSILARYLIREPEELEFRYGRYGKPELAGPEGGGLSFNLSHSGPAALYAVAPGPDIGVDIEWLRPWADADDVAEQFFSSREATTLRALPEPVRSSCTLACWTRKEAFVKAHGEGLTIPLDEFDVSLAPGEPVALLRTAWDPDDAGRWSLFDLTAEHPGYVSALAARGGGWHPVCRTWPDD
jgi:4'-phosphopantetheinyl transferase